MRDLLTHIVVLVIGFMLGRISNRPVHDTETPGRIE
jgi:hypothetical protein